MILIRSINIADLDQIAQIEFESFTDPYPMQFLYYLAKKAPNLFFVAIEKVKEMEVLHGYIVGEVDQSSKYPVGHLLSLAVSRKHQRKGIGRQLLTKLMEVFRLQGCKEVILEVRISNSSAKSFYEKHMFRGIKRSSKYYDDGEDALIMHRNLEDPL